LEKKEWYMEYQIHENRPGLLGEIASLLGMLRINIITINGVEHQRRGLLIKSQSDEAIQRLKHIMETMDVITLLKIREPKLRDRLAIRHGRYIERDEDEKKIFRFVRDELGILVDFMAEIFMKEDDRLVGIRGMPRVGKTESIVAASVCANRKWSFLSSTMLKQTIRSQLADDEMLEDNIYIIDGIVSTMRGSEKHRMLVAEMMRLPATKVVEHPDIFIRSTEYTLDDFDYIIELRSDENQVISYEEVEQDYSAF
jgi:hypothetical protein